MIKSARKKKRLSQKEVASLIGVDQSYISRLERKQKPEIENISVKTILKLSKVLNLNPNDIFILIIS